MRDAPSRLPQRIGLTAFLLLIGACQGSSRSPPSVPVAAATPTVRIDEEPRHTGSSTRTTTRVSSMS